MFTADGEETKTPPAVEGESNAYPAGVSPHIIKKSIAVLAIELAKKQFSDSLFGSYRGSNRAQP